MRDPREFDRFELVVSVMVVVAIAGTGWALYTDAGHDYPSQEACTTQLGDQWEAAGVADFPGEDHIHIKCERDTGLIGQEAEWVTVNRSEVRADE